MSNISMSEDDYRPRRVETKRGRFAVLSGCSGAGKSALLTELATRAALLVTKADYRGTLTFGLQRKQVPRLRASSKPECDLDQHHDAGFRRRRRRER